MHEVRSLDIQWAGRWLRSPESIRIRRDELRRENPTTEPTAEQYGELRPEMPTVTRIAFDDHRILVADEWADDYITRATFDGTRAIARTQWPSSHQDDASIAPTIGRTFEHAMMEFQWNPAVFHPFWWLPPKDPKSNFVTQMSDGPAELFVVTRQVSFRDAACWVVDETGYGDRRFYVGVADGLLRGTTFAAGLDDADPRAVDAAVRTAAARGGSITTVAEFETWRGTLPKADQSAAWREFRFLRDAQSPDGDVQKWCDDWREVAPGRWLALREGYRIVERDPATKQPYEAIARERHVTEVHVNEALADALFVNDLPDGVNVYDRTHEPPLSYKQKASRTADEWAEITARAVAQRDAAAARTSAQDRWIGKTPPDFGDRRWLNVPAGQRPPTWASLRGRVVLLDFSAEWCGPCRNDWPTLAALSASTDRVTVIGLHPPGSSDAAMAKMTGDFKLAYPICIDGPVAAGEAGFGELYARYGTDAIPNCFVIGPDGNVAGHGPLGEMLPLARKLAPPPPPP